MPGLLYIATLKQKFDSIKGINEGTPVSLTDIEEG